MLLALTLEGDVLAALGAIAMGVGGCLTAWASVVSARKQGDADCEKEKKELRLEAEHLADELHELKLHRAGVDFAEEHGVQIS